MPWQELFPCVGRRVRFEAVHTGQWERPGQGEGDKKEEEGDLSEGAKEEEVEDFDEVTCKHRLEAMLEDSGTIYTNPTIESSYETDRIANASFLPVGEVLSILE